jgi:hypothetical protein
MATLRKLGRESTPTFSQAGRSITKTREPRHVEARKDRRPEAQEKVLQEQAPLQTLSAGSTQGAQG